VAQIWHFLLILNVLYFKCLLFFVMLIYCFTKHDTIEENFRKKDKKQKIQQQKNKKIQQQKPKKK